MGEYRLSDRQAANDWFTWSNSRGYVRNLRHGAELVLRPPGSGAAEENLPSFGCVAQTPLTVAEGQKHLIRWHKGTYTMTWIGGRNLEVGEWIVVKKLLRQWSVCREGRKSLARR